MRRPFGSSRLSEAGLPTRFRVLFLCERNAGWSLLAEALLNRSGHGLFEAYSAGLLPGDGVDPQVLQLLVSAGFEADRAFCKSFEAFRNPEALPLDFLISPVDLDGLGLTSGTAGPSGGAALAHGGSPGRPARWARRGPPAVHE